MNNRQQYIVPLITFLLQVDGPIVKANELASALVVNVAHDCGCDFDENHITNGTFQCFPSSPQLVIYHTQFHGANATKLFTAIQGWMMSSCVTIIVQSLPLTTSSACMVTSSTPLDHCPGEVTTQITSSGEMTPSVSSRTHIITIIATIAAAATVVTTMVVAGSLLCVKYYSKRKGQRLVSQTISDFQLT